MKYDNTSFGLWVDNPKREVLTKEFAAFVAEELRFDLLALMIDPSDKPWNPTWSAKDVEKIHKLVDPYALEIVLTTWPWPAVRQLDAMKKDMDVLIGVGPTAGWETDQEFNWVSRAVEGFRPKRIENRPEEGVVTIQRKSALAVAGEYLMELKKEVCERHECRNEVTTFTYHPENSARASTTPLADRVLMQAYSVSKREGKPVSFDGRFGPGRMQRLTLDRTLTIPGVLHGHVELGVGHAAWSQRFAGVAPAVAMKKAFDASLPYKPVDHRWWSSKHIYGKRANPYAAKFLKSLRED